MSQKTIITYGTFDMFHIGHLKLIERLRELGDRLIVGVSTDEFNLLKGKKCIIPYEQRKKIVENIRGVDLVIAENDWEQKINDIKSFNVNLFVMGSDWQGEFDYLAKYCAVEYLARTEGISTTEIKSMFNEQVKKTKIEMEQLLNLLETIKSNLG